MKQLVRWQGLVAFVVVTGLLAAVTYLFLDTWLRIAIEQAGGRLAGAEINVESVEHRFSPFGLTLNGVQVTDPEIPSHNRVVLEQLRADVALMPLFMDKVIIDHLQATGMTFNQPREQPGRVYASEQRAVGNSFTERMAAAGIEAPSVDELLERAPVKSPQAAVAVQETYDAHRQTLRTAYEALPDSEAFDDYRQRLEAFEDLDVENPADLLKARDDFEALMAAIRADRERVVNFQAQLAVARDELAAQTAALEAARAEDFDLLRGVVAGDASAYSEVTEAVFGPSVNTWAQRLLTAYDLLAPMLANRREEAVEPPRLAGRWIDYNETAALPDILVRQGEVSLRLGEESFGLEFQDLTTDHDTLGAPTRYSVDSVNTSRWQSLFVDGEFRFTPSGLQAAQKWDIAGVLLEQLVLADDSALSSRLDSGMLSTSGSLSITGSRLEGAGRIDLASLAITAAGDSDVTRLIADSLASLETLNITTDIAGHFTSPSFSIRSDLDRQLASAVMNNLSAEDQARLDQLRSGINGLTAGTMEEGEELQSQWQDWGSVSDERLGGLEELLRASFSSLVQEKTGGLRERLQLELFGD